MINASAMLGLDNDPAYKQLKGINQSIQELFKIKQTDSKEETKHYAREREQDKRKRQDANTVIASQDANVQSFKTILKDPDNAMMGAIVSAAALAGALMVMKKIDPKKFIGGIWDGIKDAVPNLRPGTTEDSPSTDAPPSAATNADGSPDMSETEKEGGVEDLGQADPNFKGLPMPAGAAMTSPVGMRWGRPHNGLDVAAAEGTPLTVSKPGKIVQIGSEGPTKGYGNYIVFKDTMGEHIYAHLQKYGQYKVGQSVKPGDVVGYMGNTGRSFGAHLHWEFDPQSGKVGYPRPLSKTTDPTKSGYKWSSPLTGLQSGGLVGMPGRPDPISIKNPIALPAQHQSGGQVSYLMQEGDNPLSIINQITNVSGPTTMVKGAQPMSESGRNIKSPKKSIQMPSFGGLFSGLKMPSMTMGVGRRKFQKGGEARLDKGSSKPKYLAPGEKVFKQSGRRHMISDKLPVEPKQVDPVLRPKFEAKKQGKDKSEKAQKGGIIKLQRGGSSSSPATKFVSPTFTQNQRLADNYTSNFFVRQGRKSSGGQTIIVNNVSGGGGASPPPTPFKSTQRETTDGQMSYQDFSTNFHRYARGIKV